jgi:hypothetical protein
MKRHYSETLQALLDLGVSEIGITPKEAKAILLDYKTLKQLRELAGTIPCELCLIKGGDNIEKDGGCRHKPVVDSHLNDLTVLERLKITRLAYR